MKNLSTSNLPSFEHTIQDFFECAETQDILTSELSQLSTEMALYEALFYAEKLLARRKL